MKKIILSLFILLSSLSANIKYEAWDDLLKKYVCNGGIDYEEISLNKALLETTEKEFNNLSEEKFKSLNKNEQLAWLINLYNFYTIKLIVQNLPLKNGIRDIKNAWDLKIVKLFNEAVSLNHIEHEVIRKQYDNPLFHFALVCASKGCPELTNELITGENLEPVLEKLGKNFLLDDSKNSIKKRTIYLSMIFSWYGKDFNTKYGSVKNYVLQTLNLEGKYKIKYKPYDWSLNSTKGCNYKSEL